MAEVQKKNSYGDDAIQQLTPREHVRRRTSMYVGTPGDGSERDDALYVLVKEVIDNGIDEFIMGYGKSIEITLADNRVTVRDYGRGIPLNSLDSVVSQINTGAKYDQGEDSAFDKTVGLNGVGVKAVNYLSTEFIVRSVRDGEARKVTFSQGIMLSDERESGVKEKNGTFISFRVDEEIFGSYSYNMDYVEQLVRNYTYLNLGLKIFLNGQEYVSKNGLLDLVNDNLSEEPLYPPIYLSGDDIDIVITHGTGYGEIAKQYKLVRQVIPCAKLVKYNKIPVCIVAGLVELAFFNGQTHDAGVFSLLHKIVSVILAIVPSAGFIDGVVILAVCKLFDVAVRYNS